ncbi:hypothetical protein K1W54_04220 [Micromonospora sp. CPCC 205371]|nr:hypothetical protein [Micromonospora sp. CPCC 205371]
MSNVDDAMKALESRDWSNAEVVTDHRPVSTVYSVRLPQAQAKLFEDIATRRGVTPTGLLKELAEELIARGNGDDPEVTVKASELHGWVNQFVAARAQTAA